MRGIEEIRRHLETNGLDAAYLSNPLSIAYVTGFRMNPHERLLGLVVDRAQATLVVPGLEEEAARAAAPDVGVRAAPDGTDAWALVGEVLGEGRPRVGIEPSFLSYGGWSRLRRYVAGGEPPNLEPLIDALRAVKDAEELGLIREACRATDEVWLEIAAQVRAGQSELEILQILNQGFARRGFTGGFAQVLSGPKSALPHGKTGDRRISQGEFLLVDFGTARDGYNSDVTRTMVLGEPDARQQEIQRVVLAAHDAALAALHAGVLSGDLDEVARSVIREAGYGEHFVHRLGHGLGLDVHEHPSMDPGSAITLEAGMVVTIEPGIYIPGWGGVRIEDDALVTPDGAELLTHSTRSLHPTAPS